MAKFTWTAAAPQVITFDVILMEGDDPLSVDLRTPTQADIRAARAKAGDRPRPPVRDYQKDESGRPYPIYDESAQGYLDAMETWNARYMHAMLLTVWAGDPVPGDTEDDQLDWLDGDHITAQVRTALYRAINTLIGIGEDSVKMRPFRADGDTAA